MSLRGRKLRDKEGEVMMKTEVAVKRGHEPRDVGSLWKLGKEGKWILS